MGATEEDLLLLLLLLGGDGGGGGGESSASARAEEGKIFRKIPRKIGMGELDDNEDEEGDCGAEMFNATVVVGMDCSVLVADGTLKNLVEVELSLGGRFDDNLVEKMVVDGTVKYLV